MSRRPGMMRPLLQLAAAAVIGYAAKDRLSKADQLAYKQIRSRRSETLDRVMPIATDMGSMYAAAGVAAALALTRHRALAVRAIGSAATAWAVAQGAKKIFARPRPYHDDEETHVLVRRPMGLSYPSGHPAVAAALTGVLEPEAPRIVRPLLNRLPSFVGASRVYVGVHYPSDVIGGRLIGSAVADLWRRFGP